MTSLTIIHVISNCGANAHSHFMLQCLWIHVNKLSYYKSRGFVCSNLWFKQVIYRTRCNAIQCALLLHKICYISIMHDDIYMGQIFFLKQFIANKHPKFCQSNGQTSFIDGYQYIIYYIERMRSNHAKMHHRLTQLES